MPLSVLMIFFNAIVIVVVFIPPPVDKGEAPIHINRRVRNKVDGRREVRSTVLKPAVRGVTALKKDTASFPLNGSPLRQLLFSDNQKSKVPPTRSSKVAVMTIRVVVFTILKPVKKVSDFMIYQFTVIEQDGKPDPSQYNQGGYPAL